MYLVHVSDQPGSPGADCIVAVVSREPLSLLPSATISCGIRPLGSVCPLSSYRAGTRQLNKRGGTQRLLRIPIQCMWLID